MALSLQQCQNDLWRAQGQLQGRLRALGVATYDAGVEQRNEVDMELANAVSEGSSPAADSGVVLDARIAALALNRADAFLLVALVVSSLAAVGLLIQRRHGRVADYAIVNVEGRQIQRIDLAVNDVVDIALPSGHMKVETRDGRIRVVESDCPNQVCLKTGWVSTSYQGIVCVPAKASIEISSTTPSARKKKSYHVVTY